MDPVRLMVVDDHTLFRDGLRALFGSIDDIDVVGEASNGEEAVDKVGRLQPDVVLMDIQIPEINGIEATRRIVSAHPEVGVIVVTMLEDDDSVFAAMRAGARGYILKGADQDEMLRAIRSVATGEALFGAEVADRLVSFFNGAIQSDGDPAFPELTERERQVLDLIAKGWSNAKIADSLVISPKTVSNHCSNIFSKLQVADRTQALLRAREAGLGQTGS
ncbi:MAG: response regulator transcription factor [Anaerolineales bacterium]|jgi:DNA-binding NarL/FixJ family response regulator